MPLEIIRNDITKVSADAIVNTANPKVAIGAGVDSAIYDAAGKDLLLTERKKIGEMNPGDVAETPAFNLDAKYIIHTVGPAWIDGNHQEAETVAKCYRKSLELARDLECESIAFPLISAGTYGFPKDVALKVAISEISDFLFSNDMTVTMVVYDKESFVLSGKAFSDIQAFIEDEDVIPPLASEKRRFFGNLPLEDYDVCVSEIAVADLAAAPADLEDIVRKKDVTFQEYLFRIIDRKGLTDPVVYKKANMDRKHFSKIRNNVNYHPSKRTALALAVALELNLDETKDLLLKAGLALTRSSVFDLIIEYCIENGVTDINEINCILFEYDQPLLGA